MAFWEKISSRGEVEDRRATPGRIGGISLTGIAVLFLINALLGGSPADILNQLQDVQVGDQTAYNAKDFEGQDSYEVFASKVLGSNNDMWEKIFSKTGKVYHPPKLVLFREYTDSACGGADSRVGPHYCPFDKTIYLDETFFDELKNRYGAKGGDVAEAYVIAHETGHHAQNELDILENSGLLKRSGGEKEFSVRTELQADCFAGLWANSIKDLGVLEPGEINEAMDAASAVSDDRIQEKVTGRIDPESWTHGSSEQRLSWFDRGYADGNLSVCDTFR